jgi:hypothetical protein
MFLLRGRTTNVRSVDVLNFGWQERRRHAMVQLAANQSGRRVRSDSTASRLRGRAQLHAEEVRSPGLRVTAVASGCLSARVKPGAGASRERRIKTVSSGRVPATTRPWGDSPHGVSYSRPAQRSQDSEAPRGGV